jgi:hypothetical protein
MPIENRNLCCAGFAAAVRAAILVSVSSAVLGVEESVPVFDPPKHRDSDSARVSGVVSALAAKSLTERRLFYSVVAACVAESVTIKTMLWLSQPLLVLLVFIWNDFIAIQFLRYGELLFASRKVKED